MHILQLLIKSGQGLQSFVNPSTENCNKDPVKHELHKESEQDKQFDILFVSQLTHFTILLIYISP